MSGAELAGIVLGGVVIGVVLAALVWSDCRNRHAEATIQRAEAQRQRSRSARW